MLSLIAVFLPILAGGLILIANTKDEKKERFYLLSSTYITVAFTIITNIFFYGEKIVFLPLMLDMDLAFEVDALAVFFTTLIALIWCAVTVYTPSYMTHSKEQKRFYAYLIASLGATLGVCYAQNLVTLYMFFEIVTLTAFMMVIHERNAASLLAGRKFLYYSIFGACMGLVGIIYLYTYSDSVNFILGGSLSADSLPSYEGFLVIVFITIIGFACKAGLYPLHSWLPTAHPIAPAPASALLSGVITKCGVVAIIRIIYYTVGSELISGSWVQFALISLATVTIFMGSLLALREKVLKKRLAYSTVSQLSYVLLGLFTFTQVGFVGALLHVVFHAVSKTLLFLSAGGIIVSMGITRTDELSGIAKRIPEILLPFTIAGISLVGMPLTGGFVSKWYLADGAFSMGNTFVAISSVAVILISALLTAGYLFSVSISSFFEDEVARHDLHKPAKSMTLPLYILAAAVVIFGIYPKPLIDYITAIATAVML